MRGETSGNHLRSDVTHAEPQASDYRTYLLKNFSTVEKYFPDFQEPDCLVIVGLESVLTFEPESYRTAIGASMPTLERPTSGTKVPPIVFG